MQGRGHVSVPRAEGPRERARPGPGRRGSGTPAGSGALLMSALVHSREMMTLRSPGCR